MFSLSCLQNKYLYNKPTAYPLSRSEKRKLTSARIQINFIALELSTLIRGPCVKMTGKAAINREAANHHLREYEAFCCWTFPFPVLTFHPRLQIRIETATIQTNNTNRVLMTTTTNHVTSRPIIVPVSLAATKKGMREHLGSKLVTIKINAYFDRGIRRNHQHNGRYHHILNL